MVHKGREGNGGGGRGLTVHIHFWIHVMCAFVRSCVCARVHACVFLAGVHEAP